MAGADSAAEVGQADRACRLTDSFCRLWRYLAERAQAESAQGVLPRNVQARETKKPGLKAWLSEDSALARNPGIWSGRRESNPRL